MINTEQLLNPIAIESGLGRSAFRPAKKSHKTFWFIYKPCSREIELNINKNAAVDTHQRKLTMGDSQQKVNSGCSELCFECPIETFAALDCGNGLSTQQASEYQRLGVSHFCSSIKISKFYPVYKVRSLSTTIHQPTSANSVSYKDIQNIALCIARKAAILARKHGQKLPRRCALLSASQC